MLIVHIVEILIYIHREGVLGAVNSLGSFNGEDYSG